MAINFLNITETLVEARINDNTVGSNLPTPRLAFKENGVVSGGISTTGGNLILETSSGTERVRITSTGNSIFSGDVKIGDAATGATFAKSGNDFLITGVDTGGNAFNSIHLKADSLDTGLYIEKDTNNVGIGTTSPSGLLHIKKDNALATFEIQGGLNTQTTAGAVNGEINFGVNDASTTGGIGASIKNISQISNGAHNGLAFYTGLQSRTPYLQQMLYFTAQGGLSFGTSNSAYGTSGQILKSNADAPPTWVNPSTVIGGPYLPLTGGTMSGTGEIRTPDNFKLKVGTSGDMEIYHNATNTLIDNQTGNLLIQSTSGSVQINKGSTENMAEFITDGAVKLYYNSAKKFETTSSGVEVTGIIKSYATGPQVRIENSGSTGQGYLVFGDSTDDDIGWILYNHNNNQMQFRTNAGTRLTINSSGFVGIGSTDPIAPLEVKSSEQNHLTLYRPTNTTEGIAGNINFDGNDSDTNQQTYAKISSFTDDSTSGSVGGKLSFSIAKGGDGMTSAMTIQKDAQVSLNQYGSGSYTGTAAYTLQVDSAGNIIEGSTTGGGTVTGSGAATRVAFWSGTTVLNSDANLYWDNTNDRLGIGTITPDARLDIEKPAAGSTFVPYLQLSQTDTASDTKYGILFKNTQYGWDQGRISVERQSSASNFDLILSSSASGSLVEGIRIDHSGNVGIGTTNPVSKLVVSDVGQVNGNQNITARIVNVVSGATSSAVYIGASAGTDWLIGKNIYGVAAQTYFQIGNQSGTTPAMTIATNNNVGIGTNAPSALLEVAGSALLQKSFYQTMPNDAGTANRGGYIARPKGGDFITQSSSQTGSLEIQLPTGGNSMDDMVKFVIDIYEYTTNRSLTVFVGGYIYQGIGGTTWLNCSAQVIGSTAADNYTVRFGDNDNVHCVWIGETSETWSHPQVIVRDFYGGFITNITQYLADWDIDFVSEQTNVAITLTNNFPLSSGGASGAFLPLAGGTMSGNIDFGGTTRARFGSSAQLQILHNSNGFIHNTQGTLEIRNYATDQDITFMSDNGSGGEATYFYLDGSLVNGSTILGATRFPDKSKIFMGTSGDLEIYHDGSNSYIDETGTGALYIQSNIVNLRSSTGEWFMEGIADGAVNLYHNNVKKFETTSTGVSVLGTSSTFAGDVLVKSGNKISLNRPDNAISCDLSTGSTGTLILNSLNNQGFEFKNSTSSIFSLAPTTGNATFAGEVTISAETQYLNFKKASTSDILSTIVSETDAGTGGKLRFLTKRNGDTQLNALILDDNQNATFAGNVGINTTNPGEKLEVVGNSITRSKTRGIGTNYATPEGWVESSAVASATGFFGGNFIANGGSSENKIEYDIGPFGSRELVWMSIPETGSNDDGGWNKNMDGFSNSSNNGFMSVIYVRRDSGTASGNFYHGCSQQATENLSGSANTNPYFSVHNINSLPTDVWCVAIGIIYANNDSSTTTSTLGGIYRLDTGQKILNATTYRQKASNATQTQRVYHYYSTSPTAQLDFAKPGFYIVDGSEPSLSELLNGGATDDAFWSASGNDIYNDNSGNVGIGVTAPAAKLEVGGTVKISHESGSQTSPTTQLLFDNDNIDNGGGYNIDFKTSSNDTANRFMSRIQALRGSGAISSLGFFTETGSALNRALLLDSSQNATFAGDLVIPNAIIHAGDTNTYIQFHNTDEFRVVVAGNERFEVVNSGTTINNALTVNGDALIRDATPVVIIRDSDGTTPSNTIGYVSMQEADGTEVAFMGMGSGSNNQLYLSGSSGTAVNIRSGGSTAMFIDTSQRVGMGTTAPGAKLEVVGDSRIYDSLNVGYRSSTSSTTNYEARLILSGKNNYSDGTTWYGNYGQLLLTCDANMTSSARRFLITNALDNNKFAIVRSASATSNPVVNSTASGVNNGTADFVIDNTGQVGIGTDSPSGKLDISGDLWVNGENADSARYLKVNRGGTSDGGILLYGNESLDWQLVNNASTRDLLFYSYAASSTVVRIEASTGNVGINNASPDYKLDVSGGAIAIRGHAPGNSLRFDSTDGTTSTSRNALYVDTSNVFQIGNTNYTRNNITGTTTFAGNVGIGTTAPTNKLQVSGMALFYTSLTNNDDHLNSPISIRERGLVAAAQTSNIYAPNLNFHWGGRVSNSLWMDDDGNLSWGPYTSTGVPTLSSSYGLSSGKLGAGTSVPATPLHAIGASNEIARIQTSSASGSPYVSFYQSTTRRSYIQHDDVADNINIASEYGGIRFLTGTGGTETEKMVIQSDGDVGIGVTNPVNKLQVGGKIYSSGDIQANSELRGATLRLPNGGTSTANEFSEMQGFIDINVNGTVYVIPYYEKQ